MPHIVRVSTPESAKSRWHWVKRYEGDKIALTAEKGQAFTFVSREEADRVASLVAPLKAGVFSATPTSRQRTEPKARFAHEVAGWWPLENVLVFQANRQARVGRLVQFDHTECVVAFSAILSGKDAWQEEVVQTSSLGRINDRYNRRLRGEDVEAAGQEDVSEAA